MKYILHIHQIKKNIWRFVNEYDANKNLIYHSSNKYTLTTSENTSFVRITWNNTVSENLMVCESDTPQDYLPYMPVIPIEYIEQQKQVQNIVSFLPKHIYCAVGRVIELYYDQIVLNAWKYNIRAICNIGKSLERKFQITGAVSKTGDYALTIEIYDDDNNLLKSLSSTVHIINKLTNSVSLLPIGDSLTNLKPWISELSTLSGNLISTVGTRGTQSIKHEGRSGGSCQTYNKTDGSSVYSYDRNYLGAGSDADLFSSLTAYKAGDFTRKQVSETSYDTYVFLNDHSGEWNESDVYCLTTGNPFYDYVNKKFSINFYKTLHGISYNAIFIYLGTNGINDDPVNNVNGALGIKTLIENIRTEDATTPIVVINTIFRSPQNGIGGQNNTDGYSVKQSEYKFGADLKVLKLAAAVDEMIGDMENVYICPVGFTHDSKYNFGVKKVAVNPRLTDTANVFEIDYSDSVHPQTCGYYQMADEMYSVLSAIFK